MGVLTVASRSERLGLQSTRERIAAVIEWTTTMIIVLWLRPFHQGRQTVTELQLIIDVDELIDTLAYQVILTHTHTHTLLIKVFFSLMI